MMPSKRVLALDYGRAHTGAAISDPTGTIVRPLAAVSDAASPAGMLAIKGLVDEFDAGAVLVGMPISLSGEAGAQAAETEEFAQTLERTLGVPVVRWDERFTSKLAARKGRYTDSDPHCLAACFLLEDYLGSAEYRRR